MKERSGERDGMVSNETRATLIKLPRGGRSTRDEEVRGRAVNSFHVAQLPPPAFKCILFNRWTREANVRSFELSPSTRSLLASPTPSLPPLSPSSYWEYSLITRPSLRALPLLLPRVAAHRKIRTSRRDSLQKRRIPFFRLGEPEKRRRANFPSINGLSRFRLLSVSSSFHRICPPSTSCKTGRTCKEDGYKTGVTRPPLLFSKRVLCARESGWHLSKIKGMGFPFVSAAIIDAPRW